MSNRKHKLGEFCPFEIKRRKNCGTVAIGEKFYVFGGRNDNHENLCSAEVYDMHSKAWTPLPDMKEARYGCAATVIGKKVYVIGGHNGFDYLVSVEVFDPTLMTWRYCSDMLSSIETMDMIYTDSCSNDQTQGRSYSIVDNLRNHSRKYNLQRSRRKNYKAPPNNFIPLLSQTMLDRVLYIEEQLGIEDVSPIFVQRIDLMELHILGDVMNSGESIRKRIKSLEHALFD